LHDGGMIFAWRYRPEEFGLAYHPILLEIVMLPMLAISAASSASQMLASLLSSLTGSTSSSSTTPGDATSTSASSAPACSGTGMTGSTQGSLSGNVLMTLMAMQQQSGGASASATSASSSTTSASTLTASDPLQQLFAAMDSNGDGSVSETEMESYVEGVGGTQANADSLYSALSQTGTSGSAAATASTSSTTGITESQMSSAVSQAQQAHGGHHHHHKAGGAGGQADSAANTLLQALDTNDDGSVSQDELTNFVTANGGTSADAASDFSALDTSGSGSLTSADFAKAWSNIQAQQTSQSSGTIVTSLLDAFTKANSASATGATASVSA
jgi:Ca2+-binding EF-hand superfamily protein